MYIFISTFFWTAYIPAYFSFNCMCVKLFWKQLPTYNIGKGVLRMTVGTQACLAGGLYLAQAWESTSGHCWIPLG